MILCRLNRHSSYFAWIESTDPFRLEVVVVAAASAANAASQIFV